MLVVKHQGFDGIVNFGTVGNTTTNVAQFITDYAGLFSAGPKDNLGSKVTVTNITPGTKI